MVALALGPSLKRWLGVVGGGLPFGRALGPSPILAFSQRHSAEAFQLSESVVSSTQAVVEVKSCTFALSESADQVAVFCCMCAWLESVGEVLPFSHLHHPEDNQSGRKGEKYYKARGGGQKLDFWPFSQSLIKALYLIASAHCVKS